MILMSSEVINRLCLNVIRETKYDNPLCLYNLSYFLYSTHVYSTDLVAKYNNVYFTLSYYTDTVFIVKLK